MTTLSSGGSERKKSCRRDGGLRDAAPAILEAARLHLPPPVAGQIPTKLEDQSLLFGPMPPHSLRIKQFAWA